MTKYYTFGEVIDIMKFGEVAVKVEGGLVNGKKVVRQDLKNRVDFVVSSVGTALYYDEKSDGMLKFIGYDGNIFIFKTEEEERFVIMSREAYNAIKKNGI